MFETVHSQRVCRASHAPGKPVRGVVCALALLGVACGGPELEGEGGFTQSSVGPAPVLGATVRLGSGAPTAFVADEVVASMGPASGRGRELVIYARASDFGETLAFVIDLATASFPGGVDLSTQGVVYLEPGLGLGGSDLLFDGLPQGVLELDALPTPGALVSGSFAFTLPGADSGRGGEELATLEGTLSFQVAEHCGAPCPLSFPTQR